MASIFITGSADGVGQLRADPWLMASVHELAAGTGSS
jgi:hypothetical protein